MAHIQVEEGVPGIRSLVLFRPETGEHLYELAQVLLRNESPLSPADRELIAAYVSRQNDCVFCSSSHAAAASCLYGPGEEIVEAVLNGEEVAQISDKLKALLVIAGKVAKSGRAVDAASIERARISGADDREIHDTVLIAASFCMFNRYVDGLASFTPTDPILYREMGRRMVHGYKLPQQFNSNL